MVDDQRHLLGVVVVELCTDKATQLDDGRVRDDLFQLLGVPADGARDRSPLGSFRRRFPWLGCNLAAGILAAFLSSAYKDELNRVYQRSAWAGERCSAIQAYASSASATARAVTRRR